MDELKFKLKGVAEELNHKQNQFKMDVKDSLTTAQQSFSQNVQSLSDTINHAPAVMKSFFSNDYPPNRVIEIKSNSVTDRFIQLREDSLVLYSPLTKLDNQSNKSTKNSYEIVMHKPGVDTLYSLYRANNSDEAQVKFVVLHEKLPVFVEICKDFYNIHGLQKICDALTEHPTWTIAHLAAYFCQYEAFSDPRINSLLNCSDGEKGMSPLQVAIKTCNLKTVQALLAANASLEHLDNESNSIFHYAASTTKDIISTLAQSCPPKCLNFKNKNGYVPLHMACLADKPECVNALLLARADVNISANGEGDAGSEPGYVGHLLQDNPNILFQQDMKNGGTPLHWAKSRAVVDSLLDAHCHINAENFEGKTALHVMVERSRLDCVVALLSRSAKSDLPDKQGNRPIHLAVKTDSLPVIQALIIFGADLNVLNNAGDTARHLIPKDKQEKILYYMHAVGAKRCAPKREGCNDGCIAGGTFDGVSPPKVLGPTNRDVLNQIIAVAGMDAASKKHKREFPSKGRLLCLDGGGIRGLILVQMLLELETTFKKTINQCFDWVAGTSTGGILALGIATGKTMKECQSLYFRMKEQAFIGSRPYCSENFENMMKETFGADIVMSDIKFPKIMITGLLVDRKPAELHLFRNYNSPNDILKVKHDSPYELPPPPEQQFIWQVARATGAAPTYFRMFQRYLDGGLIANNPTLDALTEIHEYCMALKAIGKEDEMCPVSVVVSLGTGVIPTTELTALDVYRPENAWDFTKIFYGISNMATLLIDQATLSDGRVIDRARGWCSMIGVPYFRFSPQISEEIAMDEKDDVKLCNMLWETKAYMHENYVLMRELADLLG